MYFEGAIYDSASRYVLVKNLDALNWCCGTCGFDQHLRQYRLEAKTNKEETVKWKRQRYV
jgi:hypothetical protein